MVDIIPPWTPFLDGIDFPGGSHGWVGPYPYIDTPDGDASYGEWTKAAGQYVELVIPPFTPAGVVTGSKLELQVWNNADAIPIPSLYNWFINSSGPWPWPSPDDFPYAEDIPAPSGVWTSLVINDPIPVVSLPTVLEALRVYGLTIKSGMVENSLSDFTFRCSFLRFTLIGPGPDLTGGPLGVDVYFSVGG